MHTSTISFDAFNQLKDAAAHERIRTARARLGKRAVLLCHHYQRADVYQYADLTGDSLKLSRLASQTDSEFIVFCGVHFMAEVADIMSSPAQTAILPDLAAGCSMADMANLAKVERCWRELNEVLGDAEAQVTPVTYINSAADLKAFCGARGGIVCTSSNAGTIAKWAFARREKVLFFQNKFARQRSCCGRATVRCTRCSRKVTSSAGVSSIRRVSSSRTPNAISRSA
jgi:quinolinate synthase